MYHYLITERPWRHWRLFLGSNPRQSRFELVLLSGQFTLSAEVDGGGDDDFSFIIGLVAFTLYAGFSCRWMHKLAAWMLRGSYDGREISIRVFEWAVWWHCWAKTNEWSARDPWWMRWTWHPLDTFFGRMKHSERLIVEPTQAAITMPEKSYPCTVELKEATWKRPRLPWRSGRMLRAHIDVPGGVPVPGKGENSWDCGQDAIYSMTCSAASIGEGLLKLTEDALKTRRRYGGASWVPSAE